VLVAGGDAVIEARASAASCPDGPMQLVDPLSARSGSDFMAPIFAEALTSALHQPMLVTNSRQSPY
jgi:tripartite-type tricarboxylate transporter receptor subunit TctC